MYKELILAILGALFTLMPNIIHTCYVYMVYKGWKWKKPKGKKPKGKKYKMKTVQSGLNCTVSIKNIQDEMLMDIETTAHAAQLDTVVSINPDSEA